MILLQTHHRLVFISYLKKQKHVTVDLSGEGADELFGGYNIYKEYKSIKPIFNMPNSMKSILNTASTIMSNIKEKIIYIGPQLH